MQRKFAKKYFVGLVSAAMLCAAMTGCDNKPAAPKVQAPPAAPKVEPATTAKVDGAAKAAKNDAAVTVPSEVPETKKTDHPDHPR